MARMPGANWLGEHGGTLMSHYDIVCVHTIVGFAPAHAAHFSVHGDGRIDQSRDTRFRSAANLNGNHRVIAIENEDHGSPFPSWSGSDVPVLTPAQVNANARILRWAHDTHGVPLQLCPNSRPSSRGLAYHRQGIDGNFTTFPGRVAGGELWTKHFGKVCPGDRRIAQLPSILAAAIGGQPPIPKTKDDKVYAFVKGSVDAAEGGSGAVWMTDLMTKRHMRDGNELGGFQFVTNKMGVAWNGGAVETWPQHFIDAMPSSTDLGGDNAALMAALEGLPAETWQHLIWDGVSPESTPVELPAGRLISGIHALAFAESQEPDPTPPS